MNFRNDLTNHQKFTWCWKTTSHNIVKLKGRGKVQCIFIFINSFLGIRFLSNLMNAIWFLYLFIAEGTETHMIFNLAKVALSVIAKQANFFKDTRCRRPIFFFQRTRFSWKRKFCFVYYSRVAYIKEKIYSGTLIYTSGRVEKAHKYTVLQFTSVQFWDKPSCS